jgi:hypothetical protein
MTPIRSTKPLKASPPRNEIKNNLINGMKIAKFDGATITTHSTDEAKPERSKP